MFKLYDYLAKRKAKQFNVRISTTQQFVNNCKLRLEEFSRLGKVLIDQRQSTSKILELGAYSYVRSDSKLLNISIIGRYCSIGRNVTLGLNPRNHPLDWVSTSTQFSRNYTRLVPPSQIGHDVWIGDNAVIMAGLTIGHGAIVGCDAVVTKDVLPYEIVAGNPAKSIRFRFNKATIKQLLSSQWWNLDKKQLDSLDFQDISSFTQKTQKLHQKAQFKFFYFQGKGLKDSKRSTD
ncbi:CatB-related O-acetyltransferase [Methylophaga sp.]|uniref:CatB-related O-acetyltransferase n=1 Tax=Methylophaga sp. TaxID=2024840 RepID=UPI003F694EC9